MRATILPLALLFTWQPTVYGLQDSEVPSDTPVSALISSAKDHLAKGSPREALPFFDAAIARDPTNYLTIFQRGAAFLSLGRDSQATSDFDRVLELKPDFEGALLQRARIRTRAGDWLAAKHDLEAAGKRNTEEYRELEEARTASSLAAEAETKGDWETCVSQASIAIIKASTALRLRQVRLRCRFERGEIQEAISDLGHVIQLSPSSLEPHLQISNMLFYSLGDTDRGVAQVRKCLHSDPDSKQCSRLFRRQKNLTKRLEKLLDLMEKKKYTNAASMLTGNTEETGLINDVKEDIAEARKEGYIHPKAPENLYIFLIESTCETYRKTNMPKKARPYCLESLELNDKSLHGLLFQAQGLIDEENFERAVHILNQAKDFHPSDNDVQNLLRQAHVLLKRSKQKDYYKVLGVNRDADERTIKRAYRSLTKIHHPDKAVSQGVSKEEAEKNMAAINEAYEVLSDPELKTRYDGGDDPNDPMSQRGGHPFQGHPFGGAFGGQQQFFFQQGGGQQFKFQGFQGSPFG